MESDPFTLDKYQKLAFKIIAGIIVAFLALYVRTYPTIRARDQALETQRQMWKIYLSLEEFRSRYGRFPTGEEFHEQFGKARDSWGRGFRYCSWPTTNPNGYRFASSAHDGIWQKLDLRDYKPKVLLFMVIKNDDLVMSNEGLVQGSNFE